MNPFRKLAGDTAIYGMSSIIGRFLNWWLVPYYSFMFLPEEYGVVANLYAYAALLLVLLTYGMETTFFRFASKSENPGQVYATSLISLVFTSLSFILVVVAFRHPIAAAIGYPDNPEYILWFSLILGMDAFTSIPFARLRLNNRPLKFALIKLINIAFNIGFNLFFISLCPRILESNPESFIRHLYSPEIGVGYVFISNLLASLITLLLLIPEIFRFSWEFNRKLLMQMYHYGFPILIVGLAGMVSQNIDKVFIPFLVPDKQNPMFQLGIYGANFKLAVLMNMFIQAFRYAFEPFFFSRENSKEDPHVYATVMKYFVIFGLLIFLGMVLYLDLIKVIIDSKYHEGLKVVPIILMGNLFYGIYFVLSLWYKLKDMTRYGAYMALTGAAITIVINLLFVPHYGYIGSAVAIFVSFFTMMILSWYWGQKFFPIPYNLKRIGFYFLVAALLFGFSRLTHHQQPLIKYPFHTLFILIFLVFVYVYEKSDLIHLFKGKKKK